MKTKLGIFKFACQFKQKWMFIQVILVLFLTLNLIHAVSGQGLRKVVTLRSTITTDSASAIFRAMGAQTVDSSTSFNWLVVSLDSLLLDSITNLSFVIEVYDLNQPNLFNNNSRALIKTNGIQYQPFGLLNQYNLSGSGIRVGVWDVGPTDHIDLNDHLTIMENTLLWSNPLNEHFMHVSGTLAGEGLGNQLYAGMAPESQIFAYNLYSDPNDPALGPYPSEEMENALLDPDIHPDISNLSGGWNFCAQFGMYYTGFMTSDYDRLVRTYNLTHFNAAGNESNSILCNMINFGTICNPATAKNVIAVGSVELDEEISSWSSKGPCVDGRLKPDLVTFGGYVKSCNIGNSYSYLGGTSMASPAAAGTGALLIERFRNTHNNNNPVPALLKGILMNTAKDLGNTGPDYTFGYGLIDALDAVNTIDNDFFITNNIGLQTNQSFQYPLLVSNPCLFKVMLIWTDKEGYSEQLTKHLINDLDLTLEDPNGGIHYPYTLNPNSPSSPATQDDLNQIRNTRDNIEQCYINTPIPGTWTIHVNGYSIPEGPQPFALIWSDPEVTVLSNSPVHANTPINLTGPQNGISYSWAGPNGFQSTSQNPVISNSSYLSCGTYYVTITYPNNCVSTASVEVSVIDENHIVELLSDPFVCNNSSLVLKATPGFSNYVWGNSAGIITTTTVPEATILISQLGTDTYCVTATDNCGNVSTHCKVIESIECCVENNKRLLFNTSISDALLLGPLPEVIVVKGLLSIDQDYTFPGVTEIIMLEGAEINLLDGITMELNSVHIHGCEHMWSKISQEDNSSCILNKCLIEDGEFALDQIGDNTSLYLKKNIFRKNYISLRYNINNVDYHKFHEFMLAENEFECQNTNLFPPYSNEISFAAFQINNCLNFELTQIGEVPNYFHHLRNGILLQNSDAYIFSNSTKFWNINSITHDEGYGIFAKNTSMEEHYLYKDGTGDISDVDFLDCIFPICSQKMNGDFQNNIIINPISAIQVINSTNCLLHISENYISNSQQRGIFLYQNDPVLEVIVQNNTIIHNSTNESGYGIEVCETGIPSFTVLYNNAITLASGHYGIFCNSSNYTQILNNEINITNQDARAGIRLENCSELTTFSNIISGPGQNSGNINDIIPKGISIVSTQLSNYQCNQTYDLINGITFEDDCSNSIAKGNLFSNEYFGLYYNNNALTGLQTDYGNLWYGNFYRGARHDGDLTTIFYSRYFVKPFLQPFLPPSIQAGSPWFYFSTTTDPTFTCVNYLLSPTSPLTDTLSLLDYGIVNDSINLSPYNNEIDWVLARQLYGKLLNNYSLTSSSPSILNFYDSTQNTNVAEYEEASQLKNDAYFINEISRSYISNIQSIIKQYTDTLCNIDIALNSSPTLEDSLGLLNLRSQIKLLIGEQLALLDTALHPIKVAQNNQLFSLINQNNLLPYQEIYEENEKIVTNIIYTTLKQGVCTFTEAELATLRSIAIQCPLAGGKGVYQARSILSLIEDTIYADKDNCFELGIIKMSQLATDSLNGNSNNFTITPNPACSMLTITSLRSLNEPTELSIIDCGGKQIQSQIVNFSSNSVSINVVNLLPGIYTVIIKPNSSVMETHKLVIIHK